MTESRIFRDGDRLRHQRRSVPKRQRIPAHFDRPAECRGEPCVEDPPDARVLNEPGTPKIDGNEYGEKKTNPAQPHGRATWAGLTDRARLNFRRALGFKCCRRSQGLLS